MTRFVDPPSTSVAGLPETMQIGEVAAATGLSLRSIRWYEQVGLAAPSARSKGGFRLYTPREVERLLVIMRMKPLDFSLDEMRDLLDTLDAYRAADAGSRGALAERIRAFRADVAERTDRLRAQLATAEAFAGELDGYLEEG